MYDREREFIMGFMLKEINMRKVKRAKEIKCEEAYISSGNSCCSCFTADDDYSMFTFIKRPAREMDFSLFWKSIYEH